MKIGKFELTQQKLIALVSVAASLIALGVYLVFFAPLMGKLKTKYIECKSIESKVLECRNIIHSAGKEYGARALMGEKDVSYALDELTKHGKLKGINFISITPGKIEEAKDPQYKILPIKMKIKSKYRELGIFLGSLDDLKKGVIKVKSFDGVPGENNLAIITTNVTLDLYLSGREYEG